MIYFVIMICYLISPLDLIPEMVFGIIGYIDDLLLTITALMTITQLFLDQYVAEE